jgi:16S rRNA (cytidine1402-2'-O)-methyltransferase
MSDTEDLRPHREHRLGTLFVVGTPIGNLEDITLRALRTLREVDLIAAEDTRRTGKLLAHYDIRRPVVSVREHNETREAARIVARIRTGDSVALVSDAGTPGISDPGAAVVRAAREADLPVVPVPGPSAVTAALSVSGLAADTFRFLGFPPSTGQARAQWLEQLAASTDTVVAFESPHRIARTLSDVRLVMPNNRIMVFREITKIHEDYVELPSKGHDGLSGHRSSVRPVREQGEFTLIIAPESSSSRPEVPEREVAALFGRLTELAGLPDSQSLEMVAGYYGVPVRDIRKVIKKHRILAKQQSSHSP